MDVALSVAGARRRGPSLGEVVELFGVELGEFLCLELPFEELHCAGRAFGGVGPAAEGYYQCSQLAVGLVINGKKVHRAPVLPWRIASSLT